jgi:hypothetical protein
MLVFSTQLWEMLPLEPSIFLYDEFRIATTPHIRMPVDRKFMRNFLIVKILIFS